MKRTVHSCIMAGEGETAFKARRSRRWFFSSAAWLVALSLAADIAMAAQNAVTAAYGAVTRESSADDAYIAKSRYLDLMEKAVGAYTPEQIAKYVGESEKKWISEHGFARLTSNLGILVAHGRLPDKKDLFRRMMDICCAQIPKAKSRHGYVTGNDFAVKEIVLCLDEVALYLWGRIRFSFSQEIREGFLQKNPIPKTVKNL